MAHQALPVLLELQVRQALFPEVFLCLDLKALTALPEPMARMAVAVVVQEVQV
jgi:hypothetical protein